MTTFQCPRRAGSLFGQAPAFARDNDYDASDDTCSYCGSLAPDTFMERLEAGNVRLGATDKNYKVYVANDGGAPFKQSYRDCSCDAGPEKCAHWVTRERSEAKFYFEHLSDAQRTRFVELLNEHKIKFQGGVGFYVLPYFAQRAATPIAQGD